MEPSSPISPDRRTAEDAAGPSAAELILAERRRISRERWVHLLLLGFALSIAVHVGIMLRLWWTRLPERMDAAPPAVTLSLQQLPPSVEVREEVELPDPSPLVVGPVSTEIDPVPMLSSEAASNNPSEDSFGTIEAPGVGAIVGPGGAGSGIGIGSGKGGGGTSFFGVGGRGSRFAYIVDVSGSMEQDARIVTALSELKRSISALPDYAYFYVALFSEDAIVPEWQEGWLRASRTNIARMKQWLDTQEPRGGTYPAMAFEMVFKLSHAPDVVFFLTDGEIPGETIGQVKQLVVASKQDLSINTIGFSSEAGKEPLVEIAKQNRGVFRFVPTARGMGQRGAP